MTGDPLDRLLARSTFDANGCLIYGGALDSWGYGNIRAYGRQWGAHRLAYYECVGEIPEGLQLDHLCRNRACINPFHLEVVTARENQRRGFGVSGESARKTHCVNGHPLTPENTYARRPGWRRCRTCKQEQDRETRRRIREAA